MQEVKEGSNLTQVKQNERIRVGLGECLTSVIGKVRRIGSVKLNWCGGGEFVAVVGGNSEM